MQDQQDVDNGYPSTKIFSQGQTISLSNGNKYLIEEKPILSQEPFRCMILDKVVQLVDNEEQIEEHQNYLTIRITLLYDGIKKYLQREKNNIEKLKETKCSNILDYKENFQDEKYHYLIYEQCEQNLQQYLDNLVETKQRLSESQALSFFKQILNGVYALYKIGVSHRQLSCENIYINSEGKFKIGDLIISRNYSYEDKDDNQITIINQKGIPSQAPEVFLLAEINDKNDVFSIGIILFQLIYGPIYPFINQKTNELIDLGEKPSLKQLAYSKSTEGLPIFSFNQFKQQRIDYHEKRSKNDQKKNFWTNYEDPIVSEEVIQLIKEMIARNPSSRIGIQNIMQKEFLTKVQNEQQVFYKFQKAGEDSFKELIENQSQKLQNLEQDINIPFVKINITPKTNQETTQKKVQLQIWEAISKGKQFIEDEYFKRKNQLRSYCVLNQFLTIFSNKNRFDTPKNFEYFIFCLLDKIQNKYQFWIDDFKNQKNSYGFYINDKNQSLHKYSKYLYINEDAAEFRRQCEEMMTIIKQQWSVNDKNQKNYQEKLSEEIILDIYKYLNKLFQENQKKENEQPNSLENKKNPKHVPDYILHHILFILEQERFPEYQPDQYSQIIDEEDPKFILTIMKEQLPKIKKKLNIE